MKGARKAIAILGATATGKTKVGVHVASILGGEIVSADSRQVYRDMDIGTGKDLNEFQVFQDEIPYHLIDIVDAGEKYDVFNYRLDADAAIRLIYQRDKVPIICGGSGMYLDALLFDFSMKPIAEDKFLNQSLSQLTDDELKERVIAGGALHNTTDITDRGRMIQAILIRESEVEPVHFPKVNAQVFGMRVERSALRQKITSRLAHRMENGMVEEVESLIAKGVPAETLKYYGLEYKFITRFLEGDISKLDMIRELNTAIHQFAKRQETWFRRMEKQGLDIHWLDATEAPEVLAQTIASNV